MRRVAVGIAAAVIGVLILLGLGRGDPYTVKMELANAQGLKPGSPVTIGGVVVGKVQLDVVGDAVEVELEIGDEYAPLGRDATLAVVAQNLLGQKQVRVEDVDRGEPAPSGYVYGAEQVRETSDLDELLAALDPDTRTRLAIVLDQAGKAFAGRRADFEGLLTDFAPALSSGADVLEQLASDNAALTNLLEHSDRYVAALAPERRRISRMIDVLGRTMQVAAERRDALRETIRRAPGALRSARGLLAELRETTAPLALTSRQLASTAPLLQDALDLLGPFTVAARPALRTLAQETSPALSLLVRDGSGPLRRLVPLVDDVDRLSRRQVPPVGKALDRSIDNLLATVHNWSRAIQFRDRLGHIFRGEATIAPDLYDSLLDRIAAQLGLARVDRDGRSPHGDGNQGTDHAPEAPPNPPDQPDVAPEPPDSNGGKGSNSLEDTLQEGLDAVDDLLPSLGRGGSSSGGAPPPSPQDLESLLEWLTE